MEPQPLTPKKILMGALVALAAAAVGLGAWLVARSLPVPGTSPTTFEECSKLYPVKHGFPNTCHVPYGTTFVEYVSNAGLVAADIGLSDLPALPIVSASPFVFSGRARESWFAGAGLRVELVAGTGEVLGSAVAEPEGLPDEHGLVAFRATIVFAHPGQNTQGALVARHGQEPGQALVLPVVY